MTHYDLKLRPVVGGAKGLIRKLKHLIDILLKSFLKHIKNFTRDNLNVLNKCPRDVDEAIEIVIVIILYTIIPHKFGLEAIDYIQDLKRNLF